MRVEWTATSAGTGKSSVAAKFAETACRRGERTLLFAYEESSDQLLRNMRSIGIDLAPWVEKGLLQIHCSRPSMHGLEQHLVMMHDNVLAFRPGVVIVDPISNLALDNSESEVKPTLMRLIDLLKKLQITSVFTSLTADATVTSVPEDKQMGISSIMDTWLLLRNVEFNGERNRLIYVLKSRGMSHSNQVREFMLSDAGIDLRDVYVGGDRVLTGSARMAQESQELAAAELRAQDHDRKLRHLAAKRKSLDAQIAVLQAESELEEAEVNFAIAQETLQNRTVILNAEAMSHLRGGPKGDNSQAKGKP